MPINNINIGTAANNGTGEGLRLGGQKINANFAYIKQYADNLIQGLKWKQKVDCATTGNITLSGEQTIDGFTTNASRVLVKDQTTKSENGIYITGAGAWTRAADADTGDELENATVSVASGSTQSNTNWTCNNSAITLGASSIDFVDFNGADGVDQGTFDAAIDAINVSLAEKADADHTHTADDITETATKLFVSPTEKNTWNTTTIPKEHEISGVRRDASVSAVTTIDWNAITFQNITLTDSTTLTDTNLPTGNNTKVIEMLITGDFALTLPAYWEAFPGNDTYDGTKRNHFVVTCVKGDSGAEDVIYQLTNMAV